MIDSLILIYERLLADVGMIHFRFLYAQFNLSNRLTGLVGPRGVGKTTLLLQYIKQHYPNDRTVFYFSADHIYFKSSTIYEFVETLYLHNSIRIFFIDEVHKYDAWSQELKNLYDGFPDIKIIFSGSSSLDLIKGSYDLSRRAKIYHLPGLSFREYLNFYCSETVAVYDFNQIMSNAATINQNVIKIPGILGHFHDYIKQGFYPFVKENPLAYYEKILATVDKTIYEDIANFYNLQTKNLKNLSKILNYLATVPPGKISTYNIGKNLNLDDKTAANYLHILQETGLITIIYPAEGGNQSLRKPEKVFFDNTNLHYAFGSHLTNPIDIGTVRELAFIQATKNAGLTVAYSKQGDYQIDQFIFEVGGKNKTRHQIKHLEHAYLVKDDILTATTGIIPLLYFGFLY